MTKSTTMIFYEMEDGRVLEWQNWNRKGKKKRICGRYLSDDEVIRLRAMRDLEYSDREIYVEFHPEIIEHSKSTDIRNESVEIPINMLSTEQLAWVIEEKMGVKMDSLRHMEESDLILLFQKINDR